MSNMHSFNVCATDDEGGEEDDSNYLIRSDMDAKGLLTRRQANMHTACFVVLVVLLTVLATFVFYLVHFHDSFMDEETSPVATPRPNFVLIVADDLGWNSIGHDNYDQALTTPFLDSLAQRGIVLTNYYSQELCSPARTALLTGRLPCEVGMQYGVVHVVSEEGLDPGEVLLPSVLKSLGGYTTYLVGKWHLGQYLQSLLPTARGFDAFIGYVGGQEYFWSKSHPDFPVEYQDFMYADKNCYDKYNASDMFNYSTFFYRDRAVQTILSHPYELNPLFLVFASQAVHEPAVDRDTYPEGIPVSLGETDYNAIVDNVEGGMAQHYAMSLLLLDRAVNSVYDALVEADQIDNTYMIFISDNGGCVNIGGRNGPLRGGKGTLFEGGTKVDGFIFSPLLFSERLGRTYSGLMHVSDWFPTILALANISDYQPAKSHVISGHDQSMALTQGEQHNTRSHLLYNTYHNVQGMNFDTQVNGTFAIRNERYKLMHAWDGPEAQWFDKGETLPNDDQLNRSASCFPISTNGSTFTFFLFDLVGDPYERVNLYDNSSYSKVKSELYALALKYNEAAVFQSSAAADPFPVWDARGHFFQPWKDLDVDDALPRWCSNKENIFAPKT
eukprot:gene25603-32076_t